MPCVTCGIRQLSLPFGSGRGLLFGKRVLDAYLAERRDDRIPDGAARIERVRAWVGNLPLRPPSQAQEAQLEGSFVNEILVNVLGYIAYPQPTATVWPKPPKALTKLAGTPDVVLGEFADQGHPAFEAVLELKSPGIKLDKPQARLNHETPVEQAFSYGTRLLGVRWILVSDMRIMRLYSVDDSHAFWEFDLSVAAQPTAAGKTEFAYLWWLLSQQALIAEGEDSTASKLLTLSTARRIELRQGFYQAYFRIRADLFEAIREASMTAGMSLSREALLEATQRLLDRLLFIYYCEDHPQQLIADGTVERVTKQAASLPGSSGTRVYQYLKALFAEVDAGSPPSSGLQLNAYNGELFKDHDVIDHIELPDSLHTQTYPVDTSAGRRVVQGAWGLHVFDFWTELDEHMLGQVFEESLSDLVELGTVHNVSVASKLAERKRHGIYYTTDILAEFLANSAIGGLIAERSYEIADGSGREPSDPHVRLEAVEALRVADLACGSGAFLVAAYRHLLREFWRQEEAIAALTESGPADLFTHHRQTTQAELLRETLYGIDLLPQAVEIAKLALWLRSARRSERVSDLSGNFAATDSLAIDAALTLLHLQPGSLDLVLGNPPWGGEMDPVVFGQACATVGANAAHNWDSWEMFVLLGLYALRKGGRLALVLPDSLLYPEKAPIRRVLVENTTILRLHSLGPGWFGPMVRMGTMVIEARKTPMGMTHDITALLLAGRYRRQAISGRLPLTQVEAQRSRAVPQERSLSSSDFAIEVFRDRRDDQILTTIDNASVPLSSLCDWARGEEMAKSGMYWVCPSCLNPTVPGRKRKGGGYADKLCPVCATVLNSGLVETGMLVKSGPADGLRWEPFIDGDDIRHRYQNLHPTKTINTSLAGWTYKPRSLYRPTKLLIRQAGVGLLAGLDTTHARCPQSVYMYRLNQDAETCGYRPEFLLATLLSRTMAYVVFKRFAEVDPDKAHPKVTHTRLANLPVPRVDFAHKKNAGAHEDIVEASRLLLDGADVVGGPADRIIEMRLRQLWGLSGDDGAYINGEFFDLPAGQVVRELFPDGAPVPQRGMVPPA